MFTFPAKTRSKVANITSRGELGVELSRCAEPNADSIECINLIESARFKKL
jgi:hypothetical protein